MRPDDPALLLDMLIAARHATEYVQGKRRPDLDADSVLRDAVTYQVLTIGEAASQVTPDYRSSQPAIPWQRIIAMRHRLVHGYRKVDIDILWDAVTKDLPELIRLLEPLVPPPPEEAE